MTFNEQRFTSLLSAITHGVEEIDPDGVITYSNPNYHKMLGFEPGEMIGMTIFELIHDPDEAMQLKDYLAYLVAEQPEPTPYFTNSRRKDGRPLPTRVDWNYMRDEGGRLIGFVSIVSDITEQQTLQETLRRERDLARHYLDVAQFMMLVLDSQGDITLVNRKTCEVLGYEADQLIGRNWFETCLPREEREDIARGFRQVIAGETKYLERYENRVVTATGELRLVAWQNSLQYDKDGRICGTISSGEDITDKARAKEEKARLYEQIRKAQKMEALGRLTSGIAHDFNNILASILGYADLALDAVSQLGEEEIARYLNEVVTEGEKARDLITQMLAFARSHPSEEVALNPVPLIKELAKVVQASLPESVELNISTEADIPKLSIDPTQLHQAILNVCINARDALEQRRGRINISVNRVSCYQAKCSACHESFNGEYVEISVADDGEGIEPYLLDQIFEPFFSTRESSKNSGMGLATVHGIMHEQDGHILVDSIAGYGTTVRLLLPIDQVANTGAQVKPSQHRLGHGARILIVENDESIAGLQSELLQSRGFRTEVYSDVYRALARFRGDPDRFDCVVVDQAMPSLSGVEFSRKLLKLRPELPIILCSSGGKSDKGIVLSQTGIQGNLRKPFSSEQLIDLIYRLLKTNGP